ncbi:alpha/beta fold hydrolase [Microvirga alba]|uniref:Alpha/beta hydrolase n=1 Tax=Microvirga alba TaxID=2791025 RepID=A0A931FPU4_9HYPH|nr:alpha/beta hydrolase [Microvirga alba]MBF9232793.1 alpha/beta hydrolase [Microvirga alba]
MSHRPHELTSELTSLEWSGDPTDGHHQVNGIALHDVELGAADAPLVILLHGFADFWWGWRRQVDDLAAAGFRVVTPDQRGYNLSEKPIGLKSYDLDTLAADIVGLAEAYGRERFHLIGHDFGGLLAWWTATRYPDRVERMVAINAFHPEILIPYIRKHPAQMLRSIYMMIFQVPWLPEALLSLRNFAILRGLFHLGAHKGTFSEADLSRYMRTWSVPGAMTGMVNWYRALRRRPKIENPRVKPPTLVIWGLQDRYLQRGLAEDSLRLCDNGEALWLEDGSHWVHIEEPETVNKALIDFLKSP